MQLFVVMRADVAARELRFDVLEEFDIHGHQVFGLTVFGAFLDHPNFVVALNNGGFDFANLLGLEDREVDFATENHFARLAHALGAERIGLARPSQGRF